MTDPVNHPPHYTSHPSGVECIQVTEWMNFCIGNAVKYLWRADLKNDDAIEDLEKARWYISREIDRRKIDFLRTQEALDSLNPNDPANIHPGRGEQPIWDDCRRQSAEPSRPGRIWATMLQIPDDISMVIDRFGNMRDKSQFGDHATWDDVIERLGLDYCRYCGPYIEFVVNDE